MKKFFRIVLTIILFLIVFVGAPYVALLIDEDTGGQDIGFFEKLLAIDVRYISDWDFWYYDEGKAYVAAFALKNKNEQRITVPANVDIVITNDEGEIVFEKNKKISRNNYSTWTSLLKGSRKLATIYIEPEEIKKGKTKNGVVKIKVNLDGYFSFSEVEIKTNELPTIPLEEMYSIKLPEMPQKVQRTYGSRKELIEEVVINEIRYEFKESLGDVDLRLYFTGEKTYDKYGKDNSDDCMIGWKLYNEEGYVVDTGTAFTQYVCVGEKFKDCVEYVYSIEEGHYRLELMDIN